MKRPEFATAMRLQTLDTIREKGLHFMYGHLGLSQQEDYEVVRYWNFLQAEKAKKRDKK